MADRMHRRTFLGWLGLSTGAAVVSGAPALAMYSERPSDLPSRPTQFVIRNEGEKPIVIHYKRVDTQGIPQEQRIAGRGFAVKSHALESLLLPGEELTITAIEATL